MSNSKLIRYRIMAIILTTICIMLLYTDLILRNSIKANRESIGVFSRLEETLKPKYGYSEAIKVLSEDDNIVIKNIEKNFEEDNLIKIEAKYLGELSTLYNKLRKIKDLGNFETLDKITINKDNTNIQNIWFIITFKINK